MGFSPSYNAFLGALAVIAGVLLCWMPTTLFGALAVAIGLLGNVLFLDAFLQHPNEARHASPARDGWPPGAA